MSTIEIEAAGIIPVVHAELDCSNVAKTSIIESGRLPPISSVQVLENPNGGLPEERKSSRPGVPPLGVGHGVLPVGGN